MQSSEHHRLFWKLSKVRSSSGNACETFAVCLSFRRDKLWIAMELCAGGSMQDIYHRTCRV